MKKRMLLPLIFLLTFALELTSTPAAEEWVFHKKITKPGDHILDINFSTSGGRLIVGTRYNDVEYNVQVYDGNTFAYLHGRDYTDSGQEDYVTAIASRKGWYEAAIAGDFSKVYLHNTKGDHTLKMFNTNSRIWDLAYRPDGNRLAAAGANGDVYIFWTDHKNGPRRLLHTGREHSGGVNAVAWRPDGSVLATGGRDGTVRLWNPNTGINYAVLRGHTNMVGSLTFSPDGRTLVSGSAKVRIWNVDTRRQLRTIDPPSAGIVDRLVFHPSKQILAIQVHNLYLYNPATGQLMETLDGMGKTAFHPNGQFMVGLSNNARVFQIYKLITSNPFDANKDGKVDINDLIAVATDYGRTGDRSTDVNNDKRVDVKDLIAVAKAVNPAFAAPTHAQEATTLPFTAEQVQQWIQDAKAQGIDAEGIATLEQLLQTILQQAAPAPKETALLANYPNPFNPETWIPYQLAKPAEVTVSIHAADGKLVQTLELGQLPAGVYEEKDRAAYWDGTNAQGESVASGLYFYTLKADDFSATKKMLIRK